MMMDEILRDREHHRIGKYRQDGNLIKLYDEDGSFIGVYNERTNITEDAHRHRVGEGNLLATLL
jgi:hypothetical protein